MNLHELCMGNDGDVDNYPKGMEDPDASTAELTVLNHSLTGSTDGSMILYAPSNVDASTDVPTYI